ncbi:MAG: cysteine-rich CWC family protein [Crocinitomix sp.]|nr:cysteine-rich CWC family protein [Crocinitomix sp.]
MMKKCALCSIEFTCQADDIANCQCSQISISEEVAKKLNEKFTDCLCFSCLSKLSAQKLDENSTLATD